MKKTLTKILNVVVDVLVILVLIISAFSLVLAFSGNGDEGIPNVFGKAPVTVLTNSMHGDKEDCFDEGDLIICDVVNDKDSAEYKVGDVVTFREDVDGDGNSDLITHRIYKVKKNGTYQTKGDNNTSYDQNPNNATVFHDISNTDILAVYHGTRLAGFGGVVGFIRSPLGFFICILLPMIIFIYQAIRVVINLIAYNKEKAMVAAQEAINSADLTEEQKQRAIEEYLAAQAANAPPEESNSIEN